MTPVANQFHCLLEHVLGMNYFLNKMQLFTKLIIVLQFDILCFGCAITSRKKFKYFLKSTQRLQKMQAGKLMHVILCPTL